MMQNDNKTDFMDEDLPPEFEIETAERLRAEMGVLKSKLDMMFQCVKALSEGRRIVVHADGRIFIQPPGFTAGCGAT